MGWCVSAALVDQPRQEAQSRKSRRTEEASHQNPEAGQQTRADHAPHWQRTGGADVQARGLQNICIRALGNGAGSPPVVDLEAPQREDGYRPRFTSTHPEPSRTESESILFFYAE